MRPKENSEPNVDKASLPSIAPNSHLTWTQSLCSTGMSRMANGARQAQDLAVWNAAEQ